MRRLSILILPMLAIQSNSSKLANLKHHSNPSQTTSAVADGPLFSAASALSAFSALFFLPHFPN
jgi:hypothetical protein